MQNSFFKEPDNVLRFAPRKPPMPDKKDAPPLINLPPATKYLALSILAAHGLLVAVDLAFPAADIAARTYSSLGFVAARWTGGLPFDAEAVLSLFAVNFLHGGWLHLAINTVTLAAFGAGIEKRMGARSMLILFFSTSVAAMLTHFAFHHDSVDPVIGASGGISGLFGAVLMMMRHDGALNSPSAAPRIMPTIVIWIAITVIVGMIGGPGGSNIAWVAHIGGFLAGIGLLGYMIRRT